MNRTTEVEHVSFLYITFYVQDMEIVRLVQCTIEYSLQLRDGPQAYKEIVIDLRGDV